MISDLDGVLVDSMAATSRAWARWGERHGLDGAALQAANHGRPAGDVIAEHVAADRLDAETAFLLDAEVGDTDGVDALPGAAEVLALPVVAIATSCLAPLAHARLARGRACPCPASSSPPTRSRAASPRPTPTCSPPSGSALDPAACLVLEDAPAGVAAGRAAGMTVWAVATTHAPAELTGGAPDRRAGCPSCSRLRAGRAGS